MPDSPDSLDREEIALLQKKVELSQALAKVIEELASLRARRGALETDAEGLQPRDRSGTTRTMVSAARAHISAGRSKQERGGKAHPLIEAASAKGHTLRSLGDAVKEITGRATPHSIISRALSGDRRIRKSAADAIERLTGYKATPKNWPGGWADED